jgi:hypothetical protein
MIDTEYPFIELNRSFHELSSYARESDESDLSRAFHVGEPLRWPDLLREHRVILLSEAGSGKTAEIRNIARTLRREGKPAFFLRLEHIPDDFEDAFEVGTFEEFQSWLNAEDEGWILLDSVDEARLRDPGDFALAVRKLGRRMATAKDRAHILITGRTVAWRPRSDLALCAEHLPFSAPITTVAGREQPDDDPADALIHTTERSEKPPPFKIVSLDDLSPEQIRIFAQAKGVSDIADFLHAVERADALSFTARPQDLEELTLFWIDRGRIGSRLELMRNSIDRRLAERDPDRADARPLSQNARQGARLIAAAATLSREPNIRVPDGTTTSKGLAIGDVLPDWNERDRATLLSRPIFDEAIYGTVRFHHRSVREYLTAEWLAELLGRETSRRKIESLLFKNQYGLDVVVPTMRPVLPWLAILDEKIRERLRKIAPEVIFEGGDPSQLPLPTRQRILHEVCEQLASHTSSRSVADYSAVQRFSNVDLTEDIRNLLAKYKGNDELESFLLRMIWLGELTNALPEAKTVALSGTSSRYTRIAAIRSIKAIGSDRDIEDVRTAFLAEAPELRRDWLAELLQDTNPTADAITWMLACLAKTKAKERYSVDRLTDAVADFVRQADVHLLPQLMSGLNELLSAPPVIERRFCEISQKYAWLMKAAVRAAERLVQQRHAAALSNDCLSILHKLVLARDFETDDLRDTKNALPDLVPAWPDLNRALFWYEVERARESRDRKHGERVDDVWQVSVFGAFWRFGEPEFGYVKEQIAQQELEDNKLVALSLALRLYLDNGRPRKWREELKKLVDGHQALSAKLDIFLRPPAQDERARRWKRQDAAWKRREEERRRQEERSRADWKHFLDENIEKLRDPGLGKGQLSRAQEYLHERMREMSEDSNRWTDGKWEVLIPEHGEAVARAFRDGAVAYWRQYVPKLRSEGAEANTTPFGVIFGLTGLGIDARETPGWPDTLNESDVQLACRYAAHELNGFPTWFPKLFEHHPQAVGDFLLSEVRYELSTEKPDIETHYILSDISWSGEWAWDQLAPSILALLGHSEPRNLFSLDKLLTVLQGSSVTDDEIRELAATKCKSLRRLDHLARWYAVWAGVDPDAAISALTARLAKTAKASDRTRFAMIFITHLWGGHRRRPTSVRQAFHTARHLKSLYLRMHEHIRRQDDIQRAGAGVYSPELRDNAQDARNSLFELLNRIPGKEAFLALVEIAQAHPDHASRPWYTLHSKTKAETDADIEPWSSAQVLDFNKELERTPSNHPELAELAIMRLLDLKDDLENGDSSVAKILRKVSLETEMRTFIGHQLREKAQGRYAIPQEEELADAKRPDLRFHGVGFDGPVPAELKLADKWTGTKLFERLENQLCGDYLRDNRSNRGLFILVYSGGKAGWDIPGAPNRVDFAELVNALQRHWETLSPAFPGVENITVIGIDLTKRTGLPAKKTLEPAARQSVPATTDPS